MKKFGATGRHFRPISKQRVKIDIFEYESEIFEQILTQRRRVTIKKKVGNSNWGLGRV